MTPAHSKQLTPKVGKYYRYRNSYGSDHPAWWMYARVTKFENGGLKAVVFQKTYNGIFEVDENKYFTLHEGYEEITVKDYEKALKQFRTAIAKATTP